MPEGGNQATRVSVQHSIYAQDIDQRGKRVEGSSRCWFGWLKDATSTSIHSPRIDCLHLCFSCMDSQPTLCYVTSLVPRRVGHPKIPKHVVFRFLASFFRFMDHWWRRSSCAGHTFHGWRNLFPFFIYFYCFKISEIDIALLQESIDEKGRGKLEPNSYSDNMTTMINFLVCSTIQLT